MKLSQLLSFASLATAYLAAANAVCGQVVFSLTTNVRSSVNGSSVGTAIEINDLASGKTTFDYTVGGVTLTMTASGGSFSVNDFRFGIGSDQQIDDSGEFVSFSFNTSGTLNFLAFASTTLASDESMTLSADTPALSYTLNGDGSALPNATTYSSSLGSNWDSSRDQFTFTGSSIGFTSLTVFTLAPNSSGGGLAGISITTAAVPEPSTYAAILGLAVLGFVACRRRVQKLEE